MVTHRLNLPRQGVEMARTIGAGFIQSGMLAKIAGRSIKRTVQLRELTPDRCNWESPVEG